MHSSHIIHRDIKSDNILIRRDGTIKICDLGFSVFQKDPDELCRAQLGTPLWIAPEVLKGQPYSQIVDVYSYGCFAYELATGSPPFKHKPKHDAATQIQSVIELIPDRIPN